MSVHVNNLTRAGFKKLAHWQLKKNSLSLSHTLPNKAAVYVITKNNYIVYVGSTHRGLKKRIYGYLKPGWTQKTNVRLNKLLIEHLKQGDALELLAAFPSNSSWNGLPIDTIAGLESGLIELIKPLWNKKI